MADIFMKTLDIGDGNKYRMLPNVTSEDEGKVLIVTNGEWGADYIVEPFTNTCLSFLGNEEFTLKTNNTSKNWDGVLTYSTDGDTWTEWDGTEISSANKALYLRGSGNTKITGGLDERFAFAGTAELKVECEGRIDNLLDFETVKNGDEPSMSSGCYYSMFYNCTNLTTAPELPATTLATQCYLGMFQGCTGLVSAPELPATTLAAQCYRGMFQGCTSLVSAPELPATTLATLCYRGMFQGCTNLTTAPELPATTLATLCYGGMFNGCTSLVSAPELLATTLAASCYQNMFYNCTSLTTAPELPATTLATLCYRGMFQGCTSLVSAPELLATTLATQCYWGMFYNCTSLTTAPELPATTLASQCYRAMFQGCTSLVSAPELLATTLAASCYQNMFYNCTSLTTAPELPATTLATSCYYNMFNRSGLTVPPNILPATELHDSCYRFMFEFTAIDSIPKIMGTSYATDCFKGMFDDCKQLIVSSASGQDWTYGWTAPAATYTTGMFGSDDGESTWAQLDTANFPNSGTPTEGTTYYFKAAPETINFLYNGTQLQAKNGVSWRQWLESDYNTIGVDVNFFDYGRLVFVGVGGVGVKVKSSDIIISNGEYVPI